MPEANDISKALTCAMGNYAPDTAPFDASAAAVLADLRPEVRDPILVALDDPSRAAWVSAVLQGLWVALSQHITPLEWLDADRLCVVDGAGREFALGFFGAVTGANPVQDPGVMIKLRSVLDVAFGERRYILWCRRTVPQSADVPAISRAVTLWLAAIDRGEWQGRHAIYEDDDVELELLLLVDSSLPARYSMRVGPLNALERLARVDTALMDRVATHDASVEVLPLVYIVGASGRWDVPRGFPQQLLYGTADWIAATIDGNERSYRAAFHHTGRSLFCDPVARSLAAIWWVEPTAQAPMSCRCWSYENPWTSSGFVPEPVNGARFHVVDQERLVSGVRKVLSWSERFPGGSP